MKNKLTTFGLAVALICLSSIAHASPTREAVKSVWDFYSGGEGIVLGDVRLCLEVEKTGANKNECALEAGEAIEKGTTILVWQAYMVPEGSGERELAIQAKRNNVVRSTKDITVRGSWRYRTWRSFKLSKAGTWSFSVLDGETVLQTLTVQVTD